MMENIVLFVVVVADFILSIVDSNFNVKFCFLLLISLNTHLLYS